MTATVNPFAALLDEAEFEAYAPKNGRTRIEPDPAVVELLRRAQARRERVITRVSGPEHANTLIDHMVSAGDKLDDASVSAMPVAKDAETGKWVKVPVGEATHVRASVGARRGKRSVATHDVAGE